MFTPGVLAERARRSKGLVLLFNEVVFSRLGQLTVVTGCLQCDLIVRSETELRGSLRGCGSAS